MGGQILMLLITMMTIMNCPFKRDNTIYRLYRYTANLSSTGQRPYLVSFNDFKKNL